MDTLLPAKKIFRSSWMTKFIECSFVGIALFNGLVWIFPMLARLMPATFPLPARFLLSAEVVLGIALGIGFSAYWQAREKPGHIDSGKVHALLRGILRYWLAMDIAVYGFAKILGTQFAVSFFRDDMPVGQLTGFELTWNYYGFSYTLAVILGCLQIGGAILLLFRRTTLLGAAVLLPVMVNIVLINLFYHIAAGAFLNSVLYSLGLLYLLLLRWKDLVKVFWAKSSDLPVVKPGFFKYLLRFLVIGFAFGVIYRVVRDNPVSPLAGSWRVGRIVRNRDTLRTGAWMTDEKAWTTVYIEERNVLVLCPNPFVYEKFRSQMMNYKYDSGLHRLQLIFQRSRHDTSLMQVSHYDGNNMQWQGIMDNDTLSMELSKEQRSKPE